MFFVSFLESLLDSMDMAAELSISIFVSGMVESSMQGVRFTISRSRRRIQVISLMRDDKATYSASPDDNATTLCSLDFHNYGASLTVNMKAVVDLLVELHPLQSASTAALMLSGVILCPRLNLIP